MSSKWETRKFAPESDPVYQEIYESQRAAVLEPYFGESALEAYKNTKRRGELLMQAAEEKERELEQRQEQGDDPESLESVINDIQMLRKRAEFMRAGSGDLTRAFARLGRKLNRVGSILGPEVEDFAINSLVNMFLSDKTVAAIEEQLPDGKSTNLWQAILDKTVPENILAMAAEHHQERMELAREKLEALSSSIKNEYKNALQKGVEDGWLPERALEGLDRVADVQLVLSDRMANLDSTVAGVADYFGTIDVSSEGLENESDDSLRATLFHEMTHIASGRSTTLGERTSEDTPRELCMAAPKIGLRLNATDKPERFVWLNEAVTEWIGLRLSGAQSTLDRAYKGSISYIDERKALDKLFEAGLDEKILLNAYFETFSSDSDEPVGAAFAELTQHIAAVAGKGYLSQIENGFMIRNIEHALWSNHFNLDRDSNAKEAGPGQTRYRVAITFGNSEATRAAREYFVVLDNELNDSLPPGAPRKTLGDFQLQLQFIERHYGDKVSFAVTPEETVA